MTKAKWIGTPEFVVDLVGRALQEKGKSQEGGEPEPASGQRFLKGVGRPNREALEKLAVYLGVPAGWLRDNLLSRQRKMEFYLTEPAMRCARCGGELQTSPEGLVEVFPDGTEKEGDGILRVWPCINCSQGP